MRLVFLGSPHEVISPLKSLVALCEKTQHELVGVVSQPARPAGRKRQLCDPPVAEFAKALELNVLQPEKASDAVFLKEFKYLEPDIAITAAYGQILSDDFLAVPKRATINLHPSLLPKYRGATPVQAALLEGDRSTGMTILFSVKKLDAGAIILQEKVVIDADETAEQLLARLFTLGGAMLPEALDKLKDVTFSGMPQDEGLVTHCRKINKTDGLLAWDAPATDIVNRFRAYMPWPGSYTYFGTKRLIITSLVASQQGAALKPGMLAWDDVTKAILVGTKDGCVLVRRLKPEGRNEMDAAAFWNQVKSSNGITFTSTPRGSP